MMKKKIITILCSLFAVSLFSAQNLKFTDKNFEKAVLANYDINKDGAIDKSEADRVVNLFVSNKIQVRSAEDINLFKNVQTVVLDGSILIGVDLKDLDYLTLFSCEACNLLTFKAENLKNLTSLYLTGNKLTGISLKNTPAINELVIASNGLGSIDVTQLKKLATLNIADNQIKNLDVSQNPELQSLNYNNNPLTEQNIKRGKVINTSTPVSSGGFPQRPKDVNKN
ncbi:leucine-rich repeat domain-containing protein [Chryseobacterium sp. MMS23-Vi53]|uniref:leucine-rich repeat domain-containing protein n=1 Tax=Chryseobacterium sp. MMS23-Vi53 TaxID=3386644 RepID=UPI0039E981CF